MDAVAASHARHNWLAHAVEGGLFIGAVALVNAQTLLPSVVDGLGGPAWLVAAMPVMMTIGFTIPTVLTAHHVGTLGRFQPMLLWTGVAQRLPYLLAALALLFAGDRPLLCLTAVALAPLVSGIFGGISATAWQQLVARTVPAERRASLFAVRFAFGSVIGIFAGWAVTATLRAHPGIAGYGWLHLWAFLGLAASYVIFASIREPAAAQTSEPETGLWDNLRAMPALVAHDPRLRIYLATTTLFAAAGIAVPFLGIHALRSSGHGEAFLGTLISWQMGGSVTGGLLAGWAGDRRGGRSAMLASRLGFIAVFAAAPFASAGWAWCALFAIFGAASTASMVGTGSLQLDLLPERGRANRLAVMSFTIMPVVLVASFGGAAVWQALGDAGFAWLAIGSAVCAGGSLLALGRLAEPRKR